MLSRPKIQILCCKWSTFTLHTDGVCRQLDGGSVYMGGRKNFRDHTCNNLMFSGVWLQVYYFNPSFDLQILLYMGIWKEFLISLTWTKKPKENSRERRGGVPDFSINSSPATPVQDRTVWFWQLCRKGTVLEEVLWHRDSCMETLKQLQSWCKVNK